MSENYEEDIVCLLALHMSNRCIADPKKNRSIGEKR